MKFPVRSLFADRVMRNLFSDHAALAIDAYVFETPFELQRMRAATLRRDFAVLRETARGLRVASARVGAQAMAQQAAQLEVLAGERARPSVVSTVLQRLHVAFTVIAPQLRAFLRDKQRLERLVD